MKNAEGLFEDAFQLAESLLHKGDPFNNRIENAEYRGSVGLTFPCVHKDRDDTIEVFPGNNRLERKEGEAEPEPKIKWEEISKARAVGVVAMDQLVLRLKKISGERDDLDKNKAELQGALQKLQREHAAALELHRSFEAEMHDMEKRMRQSEKSADKASNRMSLQISRLQKALSDLQARCSQLEDDKETLENRVTEIEHDMHAAKLAEKELAEELERRRLRDKDDAARMASLLNENSKLNEEIERVRNEMELLQVKSLGNEKRGEVIKRETERERERETHTQAGRRDILDRMSAFFV